ncbi:hypothetical protein ACH42_03515, partial [Endozoicomonas sp. (ex Bugula neritina AB1)]
YIPIAFEDVGVLAALTHPNHLLLVGSWGFAHLPPTHISKSNGYKGLQIKRQQTSECIRITAKNRTRVD